MRRHFQGAAIADIDVINLETSRENLFLCCFNQATEIAAARRYWNEKTEVNALQLANFCEPRLRAMPGLVTTEMAAVF